jgi:tetraacyldisaccharide 4'-kinase
LEAAVRDPAFWWQPPGIAAGVLSPVAAIYGAIAGARMARPGRRAAVPVICVGNFTLGGSGKTPATLAIAALLRSAGYSPALLSRGYGGSLSGPVTVDPPSHTAAQVGDEALLLAQAATTVVARDRVAGATAAAALGADVIVMDDGLQNPSLAKTLSIAVVDGAHGIGNGRVFPAGPLRAPLAAQLGKSDALLAIGGTTGARAVIASAQTRGLPVFHGRLVPDAAAVGALAGRKVLAFAGIGHPDKFFRTLADAGLEIGDCLAFADHHPYTAEEAADLIMRAEHEGWRLLTTAKDHARLTGDPALAALASRAHVLPVQLAVEDDARWRALVLKALA